MEPSTFRIKLDRAIDIGDAQDDMVEPADMDRSLSLCRCGGVDRC